MAGEWYCKMAGVTAGPLSPQELKALANGGKLTPNDLVRHGDKGPWVPAVCVKGLLSSDGSSSEPEAYVQPEAETARRGPGKYASKSASKPAGATKSLPVAQPMDEPPAAPKVPSAAPRSARSRSSGAAPLVVEKTADSVAMRTLNRGSADPRARQRNNLVAIAALSVAAVGLGVGGVFILTRNPGGSSSSDARAAGSGKADPAKAAAQPAESAAGETGEAEWIDASKKAVFRDEVRVQVLSVRLGPAPATIVEKPGQYLLIAVQLRNSPEGRVVRYSPWSNGARSEQPIVLTDHAGKTYRQIVAGEETGPEAAPPAAADKPADKAKASPDKLDGLGGEDGVKTPPISLSRGAASEAERIMPGSSVDDLLVFEAPAGPVEYLRLALPAAAFQGKGRLHFQIPKKMIKSGDEPDAPEKAGPSGDRPSTSGEPGPGKSKPAPKEKKDPGEAAFEEFLKEMGGNDDEGKGYDFEEEFKKKKPAPKAPGAKQEEDEKPAPKTSKGAGSRVEPRDKK